MFAPVGDPQRITSLAYEPVTGNWCPGPDGGIPSRSVEG